MMRRMVRSLLFLAFLAIPALAVADGILFNDRTDQITITILGSTPASPCVFPGGIPPQLEVCSSTITRLTAIPIFEGTSSNLVPISITSPNAIAIAINNPDGSLSDVLTIQPVFFGDPHSVGVTFFSDNDNFPFTIGPGGNTTSLLPLATIIENGGIQEAARIIWDDGSVDIIQFQSDAQVPEPGTLLLLGSGLLGVAGYGRKKLRRKQA